jgi:hypothetical protein
MAKILGYQYSEKGMRTTKIETNNISVELFKALAIQQKQQQQQHKIEQLALTNLVRKKYGKILNDKILQKLKRKVKKTCDFKVEIKRLSADFETNKMFGKPELKSNPFLLTNSRQNIAGMFNRKSPSSGTNLIKKLKRLGFIASDTPNWYCLAEGVTYEHYISFTAQNRLNLGKYKYVRSTGDIVVRLSNTIVLSIPIGTTCTKVTKLTIGIV